MTSPVQLPKKEEVVINTIRTLNSLFRNSSYPIFAMYFTVKISMPATLIKPISNEPASIKAEKIS